MLPIAGRFTHSAEGYRLVIEAGTGQLIHDRPVRDLRVRATVLLDLGFASGTFAHVDVWAPATLTWNRVADLTAAEMPDLVRPSRGCGDQNEAIARQVATELLGYAANLVA